MEDTTFSDPWRGGNIALPCDKPHRWRPAAPPLRWGTCVGAWGDCLIDFGAFRSMIGEGGILCWARDPMIPCFLRLQSGVREVVHVQPRDGADYWRVCRYIADTPLDQDMEPTRELRARAGVTGHVLNTTMGASQPWMRQRAVHRWNGARLPQSAWNWATSVSSQIDNRFFVVNPLSLNSSPIEDHWPHWEQALSFLVNYTPWTYVLVGQGWEPKGRHPRIIDLVNSAPSMTAVMALSEQSSGVITTASGLSHYCAVQSLPACVLGNKPLSSPVSYFRRWLEVPNIELVMYEQDLSAFIQSVTRIVA
ncbi:MAG TPA: hypothetical protein VN519_06725 [Bryobacteraceae bacterium]|nr:hypothetical protein [Bryobacteraceae bacterium]